MLAARVNFIPGLILQGVAFSLLVSYYRFAEVQAWLGGLEELKARGGFLFSIVNSSFFCGFLPWSFRMICSRQRPKTPWSDLAFSLSWWAWMGFQTDVFYRFQATVWGAENSLRVVIAKVAMDMLIYTPLLAAPMNAISHLWKTWNFRTVAVGREMSRGWYGRLVVPNLIPN